MAWYPLVIDVSGYEWIEAVADDPGVYRVHASPDMLGDPEFRGALAANIPLDSIHFSNGRVTIYDGQFNFSDPFTEMQSGGSNFISAAEVGASTIYLGPDDMEEWSDGNYANIGLDYRDYSGSLSQLPFWAPGAEIPVTVPHYDWQDYAGQFTYAPYEGDVSWATSIEHSVFIVLVAVSGSQNSANEWVNESVEQSFYIRIEVDAPMDGGGGGEEPEEPPAEGACFWTDKVRVTETCGNAPPPQPAQQADAILYMNSVWDEAQLATVAWRDGVPVFEPEDPQDLASLPDPLVTYSPVPVFGDSVQWTSDSIYNATFGNNRQQLPAGSIYYDSVNRVLRTNGEITFQGADSSGSSGYYGMANPHNYGTAEANWALDVYPNLAPAQKYPAWAVNFCTFLPPRRGNSWSRSVVTIRKLTTNVSGGSTIAMYAGYDNEVGDIPMTVTAETVRTSSFKETEYLGENSTIASPYPEGVESSERADLSGVFPGGTCRPWSANSSVTMDIDLSIQTIPAPAGILAGRIGSLEVFSGIEDLDSIGLDNLPPAGTGRVVPVMSLPVYWDDDYSGYGGNWLIGVNAPYSAFRPIFDGEVSYPNLSGGDVAVGTLYDSNNNEVCRIAIVIRDGGGA